jgi:hypothetical protein
MIAHGKRCRAKDVNAKSCLVARLDAYPLARLLAIKDPSNATIRDSRPDTVKNMLRRYTRETYCVNSAIVPLFVVSP